MKQKGNKFGFGVRKVNYNKNINNFTLQTIRI